MAEFIKAYRRSVKNEGGFLHDRDGYTYKGILQKYHPDSCLWDILTAIKPLDQYVNGEVVDSDAADAEVLRIFKTGYWDVMMGDQINSDWLAQFLFDFELTSARQSVKIAQKALGMAQDGIMGPHTLDALNASNITSLIPVLVAERIAFYQSLNRPDEINGWTNRCNSFLNQ